MNKISLPELQSTETVVLFADISGFTMISEACASMGVRGNEELAFCINRYMEGMVKALGKYGGDIIKFVGDAMIVMWPRSVPSGSSEGDKSQKGVQFKDQVDDRATVVRKAIQCALDIQNELNNKKIMSNVTNLSVKIGIGFGECALLYVGGVFNRSEFFTVGDALTQALNSEECATQGGQIIVSQRAWSNVSEYFTSDELTNDHGKKFYLINGMIQGIRTRADAVLLRNLIQSDNQSRILNKLKSCVPAAIMPYLEIGYEMFGSETRRLTVMFASLGVDLSSAQTVEGMNKIQKIVTTVQQQVYRQEGSLNKLVMDDKGSTLICIWGLSPFAHEDDAARAILTAMNMRRELLKIENTWCNVGISTGEVFSGVVGTSGSRKEFSVLGDYVNLAARIMYYPKKYKQVGKINVDLNTKKEADNFIKFNYKGHCEFKGKSIALPIFEPVDPLEEQEQCLKKVVPFDTFLKIHSNPFLVDRMSEHQKKYAKQVGREHLLHKVCDDLIDFFDNDSQGNQKPYILAILGEIGSGKTLFARCIIDFLKKRKDFLRDDVMGSDYKPILTSSLNCESQMKFLNIWRPIVQMMLYIHSKRNNLTIEKIMKRLLHHIKDERLDIILDIFNLSDLKPGGKPLQLPIVEDMFQFVKRERYTDDLVDGVLDFMIEFIKEVLGEKDDYYSEGDNSIEGKSQNDQFIFSENPMIVILDTVHLMDEASWKLIELIKDECSQIAIIMLIQADTSNQPRIHHEARQFYQETFGNHLDLFHIIELPPFKVEDLNQLIIELAGKYQASMGEEIHLMTFIEDMAHTIRDPEVCKLKEKDLKKKYMLNDPFSLIHDEVLQLALRRCEGNPMISLHFLFSLLSNDYLMIKDQCLQPNQVYNKCKVRYDWSTVPVPGISLKINSTLLDTFLKEMRNKPNKAEQEIAIKGILLLKSAAVIGEVFGTKVLQVISPLRHETGKSILNMLRILEQKDFIEILDETDPKNSICRFRKCFLRESIYQIMLYRAQKKGLHQLMVQYIQDNPNQYDNDPEIEADKLLYHILLAEDLDSEEKVPFKSKQGLIVKKIANKLLKFPNAVIKQSYLTKQGDKPNKKVEKRLMILNSKQLTWYHDDNEYKKGKPLGVIYLSAIYHCVPANTTKSTDDVNIGTCAWRKKDAEKEGKREFIFGAKNQQERDEWITCIEYLRAKAIYENFVTKYCNISFPIRRNSEEKVIDTRKDMIKEFTDFGQKFRTMARINNQIQDEQILSQMQRNSRSSLRRGTKLQTPSLSNVNLNNINDISLLGNKHNDPKEIANKIKNLYTASIVTFVNSLSQNSNKQPNQRFDSLKKLPECLRNSQTFIVQQEEPSQLDINNTTLTLRQQQSYIQNNSALIQDASREEKLRELRRVSEIVKKELFVDDQEVKTYLDDLKSNGNSNNSPSKIKSQNRIIEENEDDEQSEEDMSSSNLPRKSAISNLTNNSSPPNVGNISQNLYTTNSDIMRTHSDNSHNHSKIKPQQENQYEQSPNNQKSKNEIIENNKKSRISMQMEMINGLQKQRELTLGKQTNNEGDSNNTSHYNDLQIFALNVNPTERGVTPRKTNHLAAVNAQSSKKQEQMEKIEEIEEYQSSGKRKGEEKRNNNQNQVAKNIQSKSVIQPQLHSHSLLQKKEVEARNTKLPKKSQLIQQEQSSSSQSAGDSEQSDDEESKEDAPFKKNDTGNFSQMGDQSDYQSAPTQKHKNNDSKKNSLEKLKLPHQKFSEVSTFTHLLPKQTHKSNKELEKHSHKRKGPETQQQVQKQQQQQQQQQEQQQQQQPQVNITELISLTIQEQVQKSIQQLFTQVQQTTQKSISKEIANTTKDYKRDSYKSVNSSIYDEDWRRDQIMRTQASGGAASSKKVSMQQMASKQNSSDHRRNTKRRIPRQEEDDDDDYIRDPDESDDSKKRKRSRSRRQRQIESQTTGASGHGGRRESINKSFTYHDYQRSGQIGIPGNTSNPHRSLSRGPQQKPMMYPSMNVHPQNMLNSNYFSAQSTSNPMIYAQSPLNSQMPQHPSMNDPSFLNQSQYAYNMYMSPSPHQQQFMGYPPYMQNQINPPPFGSIYEQQPTLPINMMMNQRFSPDEFQYLFDDQLDNTPQNQFISEISSIIADTSEPQHQFAIVLEDVQCQLKGEMMQLYEGDKVEVIKIINDIGMAECRFNNQTGIFPLQTIKMIKRNPSSNQTPNIKVMSNQYEPERTKRNSKASPNLQSQQANLKNPRENKSSQQQIDNQKTQQQRQNFFFNKNEQSSSLQNSSGSGGNQQQNLMLKLQERKKQKQKRQYNHDDESAERIIDSLNSNY